MHADSPNESDRDVDPDDGRDESATERLDRNWNELLQELRVLQTGSQILTGFLLTIAFQQSFPHLGPFPKTLYAVLVVLAASSTVLALAPVALHRAVFRMHGMQQLVHVGNRLLRAALVVVAVTTAGVVLLVLDVAAGPIPAAIGTAIAAAGILSLWVLVPARVRASLRR